MGRRQLRPGSQPEEGGAEGKDQRSRHQDLEGLLCPGAPVLAGTSLRKGIDRVH